MSENVKSDPSAYKPPAPEIASIDRREYDDPAGGFGAIQATVHHLRRETGLLRGAQLLRAVNQPSGFDCPGCAWPEPDPAERPRLEFCENGVKAVAEEATRARCTPDTFARHSIADLLAMSDFELGRLGRLTHPMINRRGDEHYRPISWAEAFRIIGRELRALPSPDQASFYTSGRTSNEAAYLYQLFVREFGTNNLPDCSNMCHESSGVGLSEVIGVGKGTVGLDDFARADAIFVVGQNPGTNHPRMLSTLRAAAARGCTIVSVNPLREAGLVRFAHPQKVGDLVGKGKTLASEFLPVRIGGDVAAFKGMCKAVLAEEMRRPGQVLDRAFIDQYTTGFDEFVDAVGAVSWSDIERESGLSQRQLERVAQIYWQAERVIICWAMGITQHVNGVANVQEIANLLLLRGNLGRPGAGACPVRGHSNVQGDRTVGIAHKPKPAFLDALTAEHGFQPPREKGRDVVETIEGMLDGHVRVFVAMGGNFTAAAPDTVATERGLAGCRLTVHIATKPNRSHLHPGEISLLLPCLGRTEMDTQSSGEQFVSVEDSMSMVHSSRGSLEPASQLLRSEPAIVAAMARATLPDSVVDWHALVGNYDRIRDVIARVVPGFADYNQRVRTARGFRLPNGARDRDFAACGGRARFTVHPLPDLSLPDGRLRMMTMRSHDQYNTTIYGLDDRYRGIRGERRVVLLHPADIAALGLVADQVVDLIGEWQGEVRRVNRFICVPYEIPRGSAGTYFPEANPLVPLGAKADKSNTPASKSVIIRVVPTGAAVSH